MQRSALLLLCGIALATGCVRTVTKSVPVRPQPCNIGKFPAIPDVEFVPLASSDEPGAAPDIFFTTPNHLELLAAWVHAVADWRDGVLRCPWVADTNLPDLATEMAAP